MFAYIAPLIFSSIAAILQAGMRRFQRAELCVLIFLLVWLILLIGTRFEVGSDWNQYNYIFLTASGEGIASALERSDLGFMLLNWLSARLGLGIYGVLIFCSIVFVLGLVRFAQQTPNPSLAIVVAMPHLVTAIAMDHVRQATAIGFLMLALTGILRGRWKEFVAFVLLAAMFHRTAIAFLPFLIFFFRNLKVRHIVVIGALWFGLILLLVDEWIGVYQARYIERDYDARGALLRLSLNVFCAAIFIVFRDRFVMNEGAKRLFLAVSFASLVLPLLLLVMQSSAGIDRFGKYFIVIQILVLASAYRSLIASPHIRLIAVLTICVTMGAYQLIWLSGSSLAERYWVPYKSVLF